jgi:hypothetical protein
MFQKLCYKCGGSTKKMKKGGYLPYYQEAGEAAGTRKPNKSTASKEEWKRSAKTAKQ